MNLKSNYGTFSSPQDLKKPLASMLKTSYDLTYGEVWRDLINHMSSFVTLRLKKAHSSSITIHDMTCHINLTCGEEWRNLITYVHSDYVSDTENVHLLLNTDYFNPFSFDFWNQISFLANAMDVLSTHLIFSASKFLLTRRNLHIHPFVEHFHLIMFNIKRVTKKIIQDY